jgi:hypothetical protein
LPCFSSNTRFFSLFFFAFLSFIPFTYLCQAFDVAEEELGIPRQFEGGDMASMRANEKKVINYVAMLLSAAESSDQVCSYLENVLCECVV